MCATGGARSTAGDGLLRSTSISRVGTSAIRVRSGVRGGVLRANLGRRPCEGARDKGAHDGSRKNEAGIGFAVTGVCGRVQAVRRASEGVPNYNACVAQLC